MQKNKIGMLYVVATPIGNLQDMTLRAIEVLQKVDRIAAEDTRRAAILLNHFSIRKPTFSLYNFNEKEKCQKIKNFILAGESIALISDAGTPLISDPGYLLVRELKASEIPVVPLPGACAAIAALSVSGLPTDRFIFEGFLPQKRQACEERIRDLIYEDRTAIFYVAPHRLLTTLALMQTILGDNRQVVIARELTKLYESVLTGSFATLITHFTTHPDEECGEIVLLIEGTEDKPTQAEIDPMVMLSVLVKEIPLKQAVKIVSSLTHLSRNHLYKLAIEKKT